MHFLACTIHLLWCKVNQHGTPSYKQFNSLRITQKYLFDNVAPVQCRSVFLHQVATLLHYNPKQSSRVTIYHAKRRSPCMMLCCSKNTPRAAGTNKQAFPHTVTVRLFTHLSAVTLHNDAQDVPHLLRALEDIPVLY